MLLKTLIYQVKVENQKVFEAALEKLTMTGILIDYEALEEKDVDHEIDYFND